MCTSFDTANYFLSMQNNEYGDVVSNLTLQKLVYYSQGFALALLDKPLFKDEIVAWQYGPVVPELYAKYKEYGSSAIPWEETDFTFECFTDEEKSLLKEVYNTFGQFSAWRLVQMTHSEPPWANVDEGEIISKESMQNYFRTQING